MLSLLALLEPALLPGGAVVGTLQGFIWGVMALALMITCLLLIAIILIQDPKGGGLTSAFGAGPGGDSLLGARAQKDVTVWTSWLTLAFLFIAFLLVIADPDKTGMGVAAPPEPGTESSTGTDPGTGTTGTSTSLPVPSLPPAGGADDAPPAPGSPPGATPATGDGDTTETSGSGGATTRTESGKQ